MEMVLTGDFKDADEMHRWGLVNRVCDKGSAVEAALWLADQICANGPLAVTASRRVVRFAGTAVDEPAVWDYQDRLASLDDVLATADAQEGLQAFREKRPAVWRNA